MAAIPTYVYIGGKQLNGGEGLSDRPYTEGAVFAGLGGLWGIYRNWPKFNKCVPADPTTGLAPASPAYAPYWDGYIARTTNTSTSATANTLSVSPSPGWTTNAYAGCTISITSGTGSGQDRYVLSNTADTITVTEDWTTNPTASGFALKGAWVVYHHTNSASTSVVPGAKGDRWYEFGGGITPNTMLMQLLGERHSTAPYFKMFKVAVNGGIGVGTAPLNGVGWTQVVDQYDAAVRAMVTDTPSVQAVIIDGSDYDIESANQSYAAHLQTVVTAARAKWATALILLVSHHVDMNPSGLYPTASAVARDVNRTVAAANADVKVFDMNWAKFAPNSVASYAAEDASPEFYDSESYIQAGARIYNAIEAWRTDAPAAQPGSGIAVVAMVTDSQGTTLNANYAIYGRQSSILGAVGGTVRSGQYIWNGDTRQVELYDADANAGTEPVVYSGQFGFEATMMKRLAETYPDGVVVFKYTKSGAAVTEEAADNDGASGSYESAANDLLPDLTAAWNDFRSAVFRDLNRTPDCVGMVLAVGDNDTFADATATAFAESMPILIDDLRDVFTTRSSGTLPAVCLQPPKHITLTGGQSAHGIATARESIRATIASLPSVRSLVTVLTSNADRYELVRDDGNIHYGGEATYAIGYDFADALISLVDGEGETATATGDTPSGSATFVVEDGSGLTTSNSYCSTTAADTYHAAQGNPTDWVDADLLTKQDALRRATEALDLNFGARWNGSRSTSEQALDWPRAWCIDSAGNDISSDTIPTRLAVATARAALLIVQGYDLLPATQTTADVASESNSVGEVSRSVTYRGGKPATTQFPQLERLLVTAGLASSGGGWGVASA